MSFCGNFWTKHCPDWLPIWFHHPCNHLFDYKQLPCYCCVLVSCVYMLILFMNLFMLCSIELLCPTRLLHARFPWSKNGSSQSFDFDCFLGASLNRWLRTQQYFWMWWEQCCMFLSQWPMYTILCSWYNIPNLQPWHNTCRSLFLICYPIRSALAHFM